MPGIKAALLLGLAVASAAQRSVSRYFPNTSPFYFLSSSANSFDALANSELVFGEDVQSAITRSISSCPSQRYVVVSQPDVDASDFERLQSQPNLKLWITQRPRQIAASKAIPEVYGVLDTEYIIKTLERECQTQAIRVDRVSKAEKDAAKAAKVIAISFPKVPTTKERQATLIKHDAFLGDILADDGSRTITIIYLTTPPSETPTAHHHAEVYEMDDSQSLHMDLRRDLSDDEATPSPDASLPLFEKYEFFSPGIFMGLTVFFILFMILYAGISAVASVKVSYFAFSKEMGPSAQKKQ